MSRFFEFLTSNMMIGVIALLMIASLVIVDSRKNTLRKKAIHWKTDAINSTGDSALISNDNGHQKVIPIRALIKLRNSTDNTSVSIAPPVREP